MSDYFLADDLSGALDAAGAFHRAGRPVTIALSLDAWPRAEPGAIVGVTTETRNAPPAQAAAAVARAIAAGAARGGRLIYKKIDSTLRGPVAAELAALRTAMPAARILFAPANPGVGRTVRGGVLLVRGVPVAETEFGRDPVSPVRESDIRRLLGGAAEGSVVIADAETPADLAAAVARMEAEARPWIGVGSGALARPVAEARVGRERERADAAAVPRGRGAPEAGGCLLVGGSAHAGNRGQAAALARERGVPVHELRLGAEEAVVAAAVADIRKHGGAAVAIEARRHDSGRVLAALAATAAQVFRATPVSRLFATGGETAFALCRELGIPALEFERELESGLSLSCGRRAEGSVVRLAIKPGGFGDERTWVRAWDGLQAQA